MQDKYVGDVGDFGKYGLLDCIYDASRRLKHEAVLGVNWYYVTGETEKPTDGRYTEYLDKKNNRNARIYEQCFPELYKKLKEKVGNKQRNIKSIEDGYVLPKSTIFYTEPIPYMSLNPKEREADREKWFAKSLHKLETANIVFLDPDNGIQTKSVRKTHKRAVKYVFDDEIQRYYEAGKSLIIYTHRDRSKESDYKQKLLDIKDILNDEEKMRVLKFKRYSVRHYLFLMQKEHENLVAEVIDRLTKAPCDFLFEEYPIR